MWKKKWDWNKKNNSMLDDTSSLQVPYKIGKEFGSNGFVRYLGVHN